MATIKSYTDIPQSKKLAQILPLESADMGYLWNGTSFCEYPVSNQTIFKRVENTPCWSLAALFGVLPMIREDKDTANPFIAKTPDGKYYIVYATLTEEVYSSSTYDNPVDACVAMIEELNELKRL